MNNSTMGVLTGLLYAALGIYMGGWFFNHWIGNFSLVLFLLTLCTGLFWLAERFKFKPQREAAALKAEQDDAQRRQKLAEVGIQKVDGNVHETRERLLMQPWWLDWTAGLFPVIALVFLLRSFLFEPFKIPSGSMVPTLMVGDLILVNKFHYGVRLPVVHKKLVDNHPVKRGDVMVFRYPPDPRQDYIKRVVGIPGDEVSYIRQQLSVNGQPVPQTAQGEHYDFESLSSAPKFLEKLGEAEHSIRVDPKRMLNYGGEKKSFPFAENCRSNFEGITCKVPPGHYFMMGDNRDNSLDSRFWGFVPDENIVGKAFYVWMNFGDLGRIGAFK